MEGVYPTTWRIIAASLAAYIVSQNTDVFLFHRIKARTGDSKLYLRNILSTSISQLLDSIIFIVIAFSGVLPIVPLVVGQYIVKLLIAVLDTPFIYFIKYSKEHGLLEKLPDWSNIERSGAR